MVFSSPEDVIRRLITLDEELLVLSDRELPITIVIFGGSAVLLITQEARVTKDIDAYLYGDITRAEMELFNKYDINNNLQGGDSLDGFIDRADEIQLEFKRLRVYTADPMDIIIHKLLNRGDDRDIEDVIVLLDYVGDLEHLKNMYNEALKYTGAGNPTRYWDIDSIYDKYYVRKGYSS
ncbi:DUF6036 family nucleotidyltransferase [Cohnella sp.]|uniref:DUF6036 family nucleotidyltransferase n=1 Tax=Cohnella sp. TaxID=1883426 RepID=UPI00356842EF